ncbi:MAG TPA: PKD domain-containing protein [Flavobacterium sp.]|nr:PKD domain-containing protein [Flavobacterium sp.]
MKHFYLFILFLFIHSFGIASELTLVMPPSATISGNATVCQNATSPLITFTGSGGTAPYTFVYKINGGPDLTAVTTSGNSVTVPVPTGTSGTFTYSLVSVTDDATPPVTVNVTGNAVVTINPQPNANMGGTGSGSTFEGSQVFRVCSNVASTLNFTNTSTSLATNSNYTINWGDGTTNFTGTNWTTLSHTYQVGLWYLNYTINGNNGCSITKTYIVFVGSNPAVSLGNPGNTDICNANSLTFPITGTTNNPAGTTYTVTFNDGSTPQVFNHPPPSSVTHTFTSSSCGTTSSDGSNSYPNSFSANIVATNPCSTSSVGVVPIYVSANPQANFTSPTSACTNTQVCFTNTSLGNQVISNTCSNPSIVWSISPSTGFTVLSGSSLGNDFSSTDPSLWLSGSENLCLNFSVGGTYTITIKTGNKCGIDTETKTICIQPPLTPLFTLNTDSGCTPLAVTATNNTNLTSQCSTPTYLWSVTYAAAYCGTTIPAIPNQTTANANWNFTEPGIYTITLTTTNSCGSTTLSKTVTVKKPPTVSISPISNSCGNATINPVATINTCSPTGSTITYAWSFPGGTPATANTANPGTINYPTTGTYTVSLIVTNECGPSTAATQNFNVSVAPVITNTVLNQTICSGNQTSLVTLTANPAGTTFTWTATATAGITGFTPSGTNTIPIQTITTTNTNPGTVTYTIIPTFNGCVGPSVAYIINVNPAPTITTQPGSSSVCLNGSPSPLVVTLNSTTGTPTYQWYSNTVNSTTGGTLINGATNNTYTPPATIVGTVYYYCIISLASGGCSGLTSNVATVTVSPLPTITAQPLTTQNSCVGVTISTPFTVSYAGGIGTATYQWFSNTVNSTSGGTLIPGAVNATYSPPVFTTPGNYYYYVIITLNGNGCGSATSTVAEVIIYNDPILNTQPIVSQTLCQGATPQALEVTASGGNGSYTYQWYSNVNNNTTSGTLISGATNSTYIPPSSTVGTLYYYCIVSQTTPGCTVTSATSAIIINLSPTIINQPLSSSVCLGGTPATLGLTYSNGAGTVTYQWYSNTNNDTVSGVAIVGETNATFTPPSTTIGTMYYYCLVTFSGISGSCATISTNTAAITVIPGANVDQQPTSTQSLCIGGSITIPLSVSYTGGTGTPSYQWYLNTVNSNTGGTLISGATNASYTPPVFTTAGTYFYYAIINFSGSGCGAITSDVAEIIIVNDPVVTTQPIPSQILCQNATANVLTVTVSGGVGSVYDYQWYVSNTNSTTSGTVIVGATNDSFAPPTDIAGTLYYYCIVSQPNNIGCNVTSDIAVITINLSPAINTQPIPSTICLGQTTPALSFTYLNGLGTPTYQWYSNTINSNIGGTLLSGETSATYSPPVTTVGTTYYYCSVTFPSITGGCEIITTDAVAIIINQIPVINSETVTICSGTTFTVIPTNTGGNIIPVGTTYVWSDPIINPVGSVNGASSQNVPQNEISQTLINTTTIPATVTYTVIPTSGICSGNAFTVTVTVNPAINPNIVVNNSTCFGINNASISTTITGGIPFSSGPAYLINWTGPNGFTSSATSITNLLPGVYNLTIDDAGGCPFSDTYTITEPTDIIISVDSENDITCFDSANGSINVSITGGTGNYFYTWTYNGNPYSTNEDISNLSPGTYIVSVTDVNNCGPKTTSFTISQPPILAVSLLNQTNVLCYGESTGALTINVAGGTPNEVSPGVFEYNYSWVGPNGFLSNNQNLTAIPAGTYDLTVTDSLGCIKNLSVTITQSPEIIISYTTTPITCYGANNASILTTISGGNPPYQFQWNNLATTLNQTNLSAGTYIITVTDDLGCIKVASIIIPEAPVFTVNPIVSNISCFGANDGSINLNLTGGIPPVVLTWSDGSTSGLIRNNLSAGTYTATISDGTPCYIERTFTIVEPQSLVLSSILTNPLACDNANSGAIDLIVAGGTPPFSYSWSTGATTEDLINISSGNYLVTVTDSNGCTISGQYSLVRPDPIQIVVNTETDFNCEDREVTQKFIAQATGGFPPYQFQWSSGITSGLNNEIMVTDTNGTVILTVTDAIGCFATYTVNVDTPELGYASFEATSFGYTSYGIYSLGDPIQFESTITGDYLSVIWDFGDGTFSTELNPTHTYVIAKDYVVTQTVTYPFGCVYVQTITLQVENGYLLVVPTAFTPNNDSLNDTFRPVTKRLKNVRLDIYDSWGSLIYSETGDVLVGWNGKIKGANAENGNYYSLVTAETFYGTIVNVRETFVLIK